MSFAKKRSTFLIAIGACALVVSTALAALATRDSGGDKENVAANATPTTVAAGAVANAGAVSFAIPSDHQAIAVQVPFVPGVAGFAKAGDLVNVYGAYSPVNGAPADTEAKLVLQKVKVLSTQPSGDGSGTVYVLSVNTNDAEAIVYLTSFQKVYLTLARDDQGTLLPKGFSGKNA